MAINSFCAILSMSCFLISCSSNVQESKKHTAIDITPENILLRVFECDNNSLLDSTFSLNILIEGHLDYGCVRLTARDSNLLPSGINCYIKSACLNQNPNNNFLFPSNYYGYDQQYYVASLGNQVKEVLGRFNDSIGYLPGPNPNIFVIIFSNKKRFSGYIDASILIPLVQELDTIDDNLMPGLRKKIVQLKNLTTRSKLPNS
jgi:hypothetical protein